MDALKFVLLGAFLLLAGCAAGTEDPMPVDESASTEASDDTSFGDYTKRVKFFRLPAKEGVLDRRDGTDPSMIRDGADRKIGPYVWVEKDPWPTPPAPADQQLPAE
jgi:hypothetical protein